MCDTCSSAAVSATTIAELNAQGIQHFREGRRQEAMDSFQASAASLLRYVSLKSPTVIDAAAAATASAGSSQNKRRIPSQEEDLLAATCSSPGCSSNHSSKDALVEPRPLKKRRRMEEEEMDGSKKDDHTQQLSMQLLDPSSQLLAQTRTTSPAPSSSRSEQKQDKSQDPSQPKPAATAAALPTAVLIPFATPATGTTMDKVPEQIDSLFNQALALPTNLEEEIQPYQYDMMYASLLYNMGLVLHNHGLQYSCGASLTKALETYEVAHCVLLHDLYFNKKGKEGSEDNAAMDENNNDKDHHFDVHHWLLYAMWNNMSNIYSYACSPFMTKYCLDRLRMALSYTDSALLQRDDLLFFVVNLDVFGDGPGMISAPAA